MYSAQESFYSFWMKRDLQENLFDKNLNGNTVIDSQPHSQPDFQPDSSEAPTSVEDQFKAFWRKNA